MDLPPGLPPQAKTASSAAKRQAKRNFPDQNLVGAIFARA